MRNGLLELKKNVGIEGVSVVTELIDENIHPEKSLLTCCKNKNIDLIIIEKGKGKGENFKERMLGSTALEIAKNSDCSILIIK
ncbi:MAG: universal stress protein [Candidatus Nitrosocosmicus sp.]|nr:universal stress protein [Candidatus Nitrosocosmicus sp.]MDN5867625.1 universal stress protein [Candidatus Nitrosocosmicus sp.]